jgi:hypothetical protein
LQAIFPDPRLQRKSGFFSNTEKRLNVLEAVGLRLSTRTLLFTKEKFHFYMVLLGLETKDQK